MSKSFLVFLFLISISTLHTQTPNIKVTGFIKDKNNSEAIVGAVILSNGVGTSVSNSSGFFSFNLIPGKYKIECKYLGYSPLIKEIIINKNDENKEIFFYLIPKPVEINKVTVTGEKYKETEQFKTYELQSGDIKNTPVFLEADALRPVQALPGVTLMHDMSSLIYLRGGNFDETVIALDDVPIFNSFHLGGAFGSFNPDIVDKEILYPSNYPVRFEGALSGILSIKSKSGSREKIKGIASVGLASSKIFLEGPLAKGSFVLSARRTYPDLIFNVLDKGSLPYYFYDFFGKYTLPIDDRNLISLTGFYSKDIYELFNGKKNLTKNKDLGWGNKLMKLSFSHFFEKADFNFDASYSNSFFGADANWFIKDLNESSENVLVDNDIDQFSVKTNLNFSLTGQEINIGGEYKTFINKLLLEY